MELTVSGGDGFSRPEPKFHFRFQVSRSVDFAQTSAWLANRLHKFIMLESQSVCVRVTSVSVDVFLFAWWLNVWSVVCGCVSPPVNLYSVIEPHPQVSCGL